ncbi:hypothetical protein AVEN_106844-1 [Araneus ventricosus]|uniref:Uncharacterized protein n=1 Tax=Araneus ventricosus TaxID=182803 RepID=A0A4Y2SI35_ARAVE|nr:hypothetical protein AVEN_245286-1 [Araneus ventricosus]GBN74542.1 hypothetical protein AVEN_70912-1 [Araneus ventricosus]GBN87276.1 hypothetical protein AVEN_267359-1 [Araneus ventricosus]GBN87287.1 hypothetical protein AVEN_106844-1 [Araneus ventricosus]
MKGEQSGVKSSPENTVKERRQQIDLNGRKLFQPFEYMTSSQIRSLFSRMSVLYKGGTLKPPSPGLELVDDVNEDLDDITEHKQEQQEVQNLLTTLEPIHDVQLQLAGYTQEKDDKGKKRSLTICPTIRKRIKAMECDRYGVSDRTATLFASAVLQDIGIVHEGEASHVVDRNKIRRQRKKL